MASETIFKNINAVLLRIGRNTGWLLGGKGVGAALSIVYLAIAARTLGPEGFGQFVLVLTYAQAVSNLVQFRSWQTLIRFGAEHTGDRGRLSRLIGFSAMLDGASAAVGAVLAVAGAILIGAFVDWSGVEQRNAALFGISLLFAMRATPTGILRLFDRFDSAMIAETVLPLIRFLGAVVVGLMSGPVIAFLIVWAAAELLTSLALWVAALRELKRRELTQRPRGNWLTTVVGENPGLWRFAWLTNASSTITLVWRQAGTLAVGMAASPAAAGGYRLAQQLSQALAKPISALARAGYPEFAHMVARRDPLLTPLITRVAILTLAAAGAIIALAVLFGGLVIQWVAGEEFAFAEPYLVLLSVAVAVELCGVVIEPLLLAMNRPGRVLACRSLAAIVYLGALAAFMVTFGPVGAALGAIAGSLALVILLAVAVRGSLIGYEPGEARLTRLDD